MSDIQRNLQKILSAVWGKDVRQAIHDSIHDCYEDGKAGVLDLIARQNIEVLKNTKADKTALDQEKTERLAEVAVERARIDNITSLPEGSTTGDAELADGRIGYDGTTYQNLGTAIRTQVEDLNDGLDTAENNITNLQNDVIDLKEDLYNIEPLSEKAKKALLACFRNVAWINENGQDYYDTLYEALYTEKPPKEEVIAELTSDDITYGYGMSSNKNEDSRFAYPNTKRAAYLDFDISFTPGESYKFTWDNSTLPDSALSMQILNQVALDKVTSGASSVNIGGDFFDIGWLQNGVVVKIPETYNDSPMTVCRIGFKANNEDNMDVTAGSIGWVKIVKDATTEDADKVRIIPKDELSYHVGVLNDPPYYTTYERAERICHWEPVDIAKEATYVVKFEKSNSYQNAQIGIDCYNENAINAMNQNTAINASDLVAVGNWLNTNSEFAIPATINNSIPKGIRFSFRANASNSKFTSSDAIHYVYFIKGV